MRYVITGAGQIGSQLARDLLAAGHEVTVVRRGAEVEDGAELLQGDAGDRSLVQRAVAGPEGTASAIFHCIHTDYDSAAWLRDLPHRELAVMDVAADADIPVIFPESVDACGYRARDLSEPLTSDDVEPVSPLGKVRADLLAARAAHPARTVSVVAADLVGPTATPGSSVFQLLVFGPAVSSRTAWVLGDPDAARSMTSIPDLTSAMVAAANESDVLAADGDVIVTSPSTGPVPQRTMAQDVARAGCVQPRPVRKIPWWVVRLAGFSSATMRELYGNRYLWDAPAVIRPGVLETRLGITPASWNDVIRDTVGRAASPR